MSEPNPIAIFSKLSAALDLDRDVTVRISLPSSGRWIIRAGEPPAQETAEVSEVDLEIVVRTAGGEDRFLAGEIIPQSEILRGEWEAVGSAELLMRTSEAIWRMQHG